MALPDLDRIKRFVRDQLPEDVRAHCERTGEQARRLAAHHGIDEDKAEAAGLLHDVVRYYSRDELDEAIRDIGFGTLEFHGVPDEVLHGPAGALLVEQQLAVNDKEILEAISLHTTAASDMGEVAKVVFLADFTEEGRHFPEAEEDRRMCLGDLDTAVLHVLGRKLAHIISKRLPVDQRAWQAYNAFATRVAAKGGTA